jgi:hypothetical protein
MAAMNEQCPLPRRTALMAELQCIAETARMLADRRIHLPDRSVGRYLRFANGTSAPVYRETVVDRDPVTDPCVLVVCFRLRLLRGFGHTLFRWESILNTPLFVGFPGYVSKLWLAHDQHHVYRGVYEWDGPDRAEHYARSLWRVLAIGSVPGTIAYQVVPGLRRDEMLADPRLLDGFDADDRDGWWRLVDVQ